MPQIGQDPGLSLTISGCMGQVYSTACGSNAMPQEGHGPGLLSRTSGSMGQTYTTPPPLAAGDWDAAEVFCGGVFIGCTVFTPPSCTNPVAGFALRYFSGSALNLFAHPVQQK